MNKDRLTIWALFLLSAGIVISAVLGPLVFDIIRFHISDTMEHQLVGGEIASLLLAAPLAALAAGLWLRGHPVAPVLAIGPAIYAVYTYVQYIVGPEYSRYEGNNENAFPLYIALFILGWTIAASAWIKLRAALIPTVPSRLRMAIGILLLLSNGIFTLAWIASLLDVFGGDPSLEYQRDPQLFWLIRLLDLGLVIPMGVTVGIGLLQSTPWSSRLIYPMVGFQTLIVTAVAGMASRMTIMDDPSADPVLLLVTLVMSVAFLVVATLLFRHAEQQTESCHDSDTLHCNKHIHTSCPPRQTAFRN